MKQAQYSPLNTAEMAFSLFAANEGYLDDVETSKVVAFEAALHQDLAAHQSAGVAAVTAKADGDDDVEAKFHDAMKDFKANNTW
jgi:F-type H+-transporting ATPase subunit alpha